MKEVCYPKNKEFKLLPQQLFVPDYIENNIDDMNGLLIFHEIGSGKTCTAIRICEKFKKTKKIVVVLPASLIGNFRNELRSKCPGENMYITKEEKKLLDTLNPMDKKYNKIIEKSNERIDKYYNIYSYQIFTKEVIRGMIEMENTILIIDEVQNMVSLKGTFYYNLKRVIDKADIDSKVFLLSATPMFDNPSEIALTLNLLRPKNTFPVGEDFFYTYLMRHADFYQAFNLEDFKINCTGLISYYRGNLPISYPRAKIQVIRCLMSDHQLGIYRIERAKNKKKKTKRKIIDSFSFPKAYLVGSRIISNIAYPNGMNGMEGFESLEGNMDRMRDYSCKIVKIIKKIESSFGPIFIYSTFLDIGGIKPIVEYLKFNGYKDFEKEGPGNMRFAVYSGNQSLTKREKIKKVFNSYKNKDGDHIKIIIGSPSTREGISFLRVNQVHILEPHWNYSRLKQIMGRAIRFCSHKDLPDEKQFVNVFLYLAVHPKIGKSVDEHLWSISKKKYTLIKEFEHAMKEVAIDCKIFLNRNSLPSDKLKIKCN